ncbi:hypothetical protein [Microbacterium sp.]|uniref:hypothetical protein n=1 Tax=Microbacterium sp. TaxID=51671 RepID=UPI00281270DB|nr:hypothetical protein [Microbacterium sp.]
MSDAQRGNATHGPELDEQLEQESRGIVQGAPGSAHAEPFRETEPLPDDTDDPEVERAFRRDGPEIADGDADPADAEEGAQDG